MAETMTLGRKPGPPKEFPIQMNLRISEVEQEALGKIAERTGEDRSEIIRRLIREETMIAETMTLKPPQEDEAKMETTIQDYFDELRRLDEQMAEDDREIARLRAETTVIAAASRAIGEQTREIAKESWAIGAESKTMGEESRAIRDQTRALAEQTRAIIASIGAAS